MESQSETALSYLGTYSRWQIITAVTCGIGFGLVFPVHVLPTGFIQHTPTFHCKSSPLAAPSLLTHNITTTSPTQCEYTRESDEGNITSPCENWSYHIDAQYEQTVVTTWDLVCSRGWTLELSNLLSDVGTTIGCLLPTMLADTYGRRYVYLACMWATVASAAIQALSPGLGFYTTAAIIGGIAQQGMVTVSFVLVMELFGRNERTLGGLIPQYIWCVAYLLVALFLYLIRHWRHLLLTLNVPLFMTVVLLWFVPESIPWLVAKEKRKEAEEILHRAARYNSRTIPPTHLLWQKPPPTPTAKVDQPQGCGWGSWKHLAAGVKCETLKEVVKSSLLRKYTVILLFIWSVNYFAYVTRVLQLTDIFTTSNPYGNFALYAVIEIPPYAAAWFVLQKFGRRIPFCIYHITGGVFVLLSLIEFSELSAAVKSPLIIAFTVLIKMSFASSFATLYILTTELYPTKIRCTGLGVCKFLTGILTHITYFTPPFSSWIPRTILGLLAVVAGALVFLLPETRYKPLPETIAEVEQWDRHKDVRYEASPEPSAMESQQHGDQGATYTLTDDMEEYQPSSTVPAPSVTVDITF